MSTTVENLPDFIAKVRQTGVAHQSMVPQWLTATSDIVETNLTVGGAYSPGTPIDTGVARAGWVRTRGRVVETFANRVPYIAALERGHSRQAPDGFRGLVALHWKDIQRDGLRAIGLAALASRVR
jgi:hypothetical protein